MAYWLKGAGTSTDPLLDDWPRRSLLWRTANFPRRPSIRTGDRIVVWAIGSGRVLEDQESRFFAIADVTSDPEPCAHERWPWTIDVDFITAVPTLREAPRLSDIQARPHRSPHARLTDAQGQRAERLLPSDPSVALERLVERDVPPERRGASPP